MASMASEADRSLAKVSIAILAVCMLTTSNRGSVQREGSSSGKEL